MSLLILKTFKITKAQASWLKSLSVRTGLRQVEIVRRALDTYAESEELKAQKLLFSRSEREDIREMARKKGLSERDTIREAVNKERRFMEKVWKSKPK